VGGPVRGKRINKVFSRVPAPSIANKNRRLRRDRPERKDGKERKKETCEKRETMVLRQCADADHVASQQGWGL